MEKIKLQYVGKYPEYISFPDGCERSCKGSLYLLPGRIKEVTSDEYKHLKNHHKDLRFNVYKAEAKPKPPARKPKLKLKEDDDELKESKGRSKKRK